MALQHQHKILQTTRKYKDLYDETFKNFPEKEQKLLYSPFTNTWKKQYQ
jgi:hypothetical protein